MIVWATIRSQAFGTPLMMGNIIPEVGLLLMLAVGLRLGVVPLHLPYGEEPRLRRGLGTIVRLATAASSLVVLARLPMQAVPARWHTFMLVFSALAAVYGGAQWAAAKNELDGRPYLVIAVAGLAYACVMQGNSIASIAWGMGLILFGGLLFLASVHYLPVYIIAGLGLFSFSGLPFTPMADGLIGLWGTQFSVMNLFFILAHALILLGYVRHALREAGEIDGLESWSLIVYAAGLGGLVVVSWVISVYRLAGGLTVGLWWVSVPAVLLAGLVWWFLSRSSAREELIEGSGWIAIVSRPVGRWVGWFFSLNWLYRSLYFIYRITQQLIRFFSLLLEGQGGMLWALLLLALLSTVIASGVNP